MYFPNAFKKVYVPAITGGALVTRTTGTTAALTAGQLGLFDSKTFAAITAAGAAGTNQPFILAQGSYYTTDKIGPFHGGYKESNKSKVVNPKYVSRFFKVAAKTAQSQIITIGWDQSLTGASTLIGPKFECGKTYRLRLDVKGSPALRFVDHNLYRTLDAFTGCCANNCNTGCTGDPVDAAKVLLTFKDQINADPILNKFVLAKVFKRGGTSGAGTLGEVDSATYVPVTDNTGGAVAAVVASLQLQVAYTDTVFGNCTFTVTDKYDLEPLFLYASLVDESGDPCIARNIINSATGEMVKELQVPRQASGVGETVLRDLILSERYLQNNFPDGDGRDQFRLREVIGDPTLTTVSRSALYDQIYLLHSVPRFYNPTGVFDNDQYLLVINVPTGTDTTAFTTLIQNILNNAGNGIALENY